MKGRAFGVKSAQAAFALVCTLVPALFGRADAALMCSGEYVSDSSGCRADDINAKFPGALLDTTCLAGNFLFSTSKTNAQATAIAINLETSHAQHSGPDILARVSTRAHIFVLS